MNKVICLVCGKEFEAKRPYPVAKYCSDECREVERARLRNKEENKQKKREWYQRVKERERERSRRWYANHRESEIKKNEQYRKENRELFDWYHDKARFNGMREAILKRDGRKCCICAKTSSLNIHHIDGSGYASVDDPRMSNNDKENLMTLCSSCHHKLHHWQRKNKKQITTRKDIVRTMAKVIEASSKS